MTQIWTPNYPNTMTPLDQGQTLRSLIAEALRNIDLFDRVPMDGETEKVGRSTVELSGKKTYRQQFEEGLAVLAMRKGWTGPQCTEVARLRQACPPNALYRVRAGFHSETRGLAPIGIILSYRPGQRGGPAEAGLQILGVQPGARGAADNPLSVPAEGLEDVTALAREGKLTGLDG